MTKHAIPWFLEDIDPIFKILKNSLDDLRDFVDPTFSNMFKVSDFQHFEISKIIFSKNRFVISLAYLKYLGVSKSKNNGHWESWSRPLGPKIPKSENHEHEKVFYCS